MAEFATTLVSGAIGIAGVAVGAFFQYKQERAKERRERLYTPAEAMHSRLRGAASSLDYLVHGRVDGQPLEGDAFDKAKHFVWEANASRAAIEFAFWESTKVFELATGAVEQLAKAYDVAVLGREDKLGEQKEEKLKAAKADYNRAIAEFVQATRGTAKG
jgi:hypothetical protein